MGLGFGGSGSVLEVILEDFCGEGRAYLAGVAWSCAFGANYFSPANYFRGGEAGDFYRQHKIDLQLSIGLERLLGVEEKAGAAYVFGGAGTPAFFSHLTIAERQVEVVAAGAERWDLF